MGTRSTERITRNNFNEPIRSDILIACNSFWLDTFEIHVTWRMYTFSGFGWRMNDTQSQEPVSQTVPISSE